MKNIYRCSGTNVLQQRLMIDIPSCCFLDVIKGLFKKDGFLHLGHDQFPQLSNNEDCDPDFESYRLVLWDYYKYSPAVTKKGISNIPTDDKKETLISPSRSDNKCLRDGFLCSLSKFKSYRDSPEFSIHPKMDSLILWQMLIEEVFLFILSKFKSYRVPPELSFIFKGQTSLFPGRSSERKILYSDIRYHNPLQSLQI